MPRSNTFHTYVNTRYAVYRPFYRTISWWIIQTVVFYSYPYRTQLLAIIAISISSGLSQTNKCGCPWLCVWLIMPNLYIAYRYNTHIHLRFRLYKLTKGTTTYLGCYLYGKYSYIVVHVQCKNQGYRISQRKVKLVICPAERESNSEIFLSILDWFVSPPP